MSYRGKSLEDYAHDIDMPTTRTAGIPERLTKGIFTSRMVSTGNAFTRIAPLLPINVSWDREGRVLSVTSIKTLTPTADSAYWNLATVYATLLKQLSDAFSGASFAQLSSSVISTRLPSRYDIRAAIAELTSLLNTHLFGQRWDRNMRVHEQFLCMDDFKMGVPSEVEIGESGHFLLATEPPSLALATVTGIRTRWTHWLALHEAMGLRNMAPFLYDYFLYQGLDSTTTLSNEGIGVLLESLLGRGQQNPTDILSRIQISQYLAYIMLAISVFGFVQESVSRDTIFGTTTFELNTRSDLRAAVANFDAALQATADGGAWVREGDGPRLYALPLAADGGHVGAVNLATRVVAGENVTSRAFAFIPQLLPANQGETGPLPEVEVVLDALDGVRGDVSKEHAASLRVARVTYASFGTFRVRDRKLFTSSDREPQVFTRWVGDLAISALSYDHAGALFMGFESMYAGNEYPVDLQGTKVPWVINKDVLIGTEHISVTRATSPLEFKIEGSLASEEDLGPLLDSKEHIENVLGRTMRLFPTAFTTQEVHESSSAEDEHLLSATFGGE